MSQLPPRRPLDHLLVEAAEIHTRRTRGPACKVARIVLIFGDGGQKSIDVTAELRAEAKRSREAVAEQDRADTVSLTKMERTCLEALAEAEEPLTADETAAKAGYEPGAAVRRAMSGLVKKGCAAKRGGYEVTELGRRVIGAGRA